MIKHIRKIPYVDIGLQHRAISKELLYEIEKVINHGQFVLGKEVDLFEKKLADLCGVKFSIGVNSGTDALILALQVLGIGHGDEVITAPNSFVSTASAIKLSGAIPRFVDVDNSYNIDPRQIEKQITNKKPLTVMDERMTRFIMSISEAAEMILNVTHISKDGEIFILKMPSVKIEELAKGMLQVFIDRFGSGKILNLLDV